MKHGERDAHEDPLIRGDFVFFWHGWPSQWHPSRFEIDGVAYSCAEQFMMAEKARLFDDTEVLAKILEARQPAEHKAFGRAVRNFEEARWNANARDIVHRGNLAKFSQNADLWALLDATADRTLAEASPTDRVWGIGLGAAHPDATDPSKWPGKNWLGEVLMRVRADLRASALQPRASDR